jgi:hypothetical protein
LQRPGQLGGKRSQGGGVSQTSGTLQQSPFTTRQRQQQLHLHRDRGNALFEQQIRNHLSQHLSLKRNTSLAKIWRELGLNDVLLALIQPGQTQDTIRSSKNHTPPSDQAGDLNQQAIQGREAIAQISQLQVLLLDAS